MPLIMAEKVFAYGGGTGRVCRPRLVTVI